MCGSAGSGCSLVRSIARRSSGFCRVCLCTRELTFAHHASHSRASSANEVYSGRRFAPMGTRSAFAIRTEASAPPLDSGSYGTHVRTWQP